MSALFSNGQRSRRDPKQPGETSWDFLDRQAGPFWNRIRVLLETWYGEIPDPTGRLLGAFKSGNLDQHHSAFWEMYLHAAFLRSGWSVVFDAHGMPDFRLERGDQRLYVEATIAGALPPADRAQNARAETVFIELNKINSPDFYLGIDIVKAGDTAVALGPLRKQAEAWVATIDWVSVVDQASRSSFPDYPEKLLQAGSWTVELTALPKSAGSRGSLMSGAMWSGGQADLPSGERVVQAPLAGKASKYKNLDAPLVLALMLEAVLVGVDDIESALYGRTRAFYDPSTGNQVPLPRQRTDCFWTDQPRTSRASVPGVLVARELRPHTITRTALTWWQRPDLAAPPPMLAQTFALSGELASATTPAPDMTVFWGLSPEWPGPEPAFDRDVRRG